MGVGERALTPVTSTMQSWDRSFIDHLHYWRRDDRRVVRTGRQSDGGLGVKFAGSADERFTDDRINVAAGSEVDIAFSQMNPCFGRTMAPERLLHKGKRHVLISRFNDVALDDLALVVDRSHR